MARWGNRYDANRTLVQIVHRRCRIVAGHAPKLLHVQALDHVDERGDRVGLHLPRDLPSVDLRPSTLRNRMRKLGIRRPAQ